MEKNVAKLIGSSWLDFRFRRSPEFSSHYKYTEVLCDFARQYLFLAVILIFN